MKREEGEDKEEEEERKRGRRGRENNFMYFITSTTVQLCVNCKSFFTTSPSPPHTHLLHVGPVLAAEVERFDAQHPGNADDSHYHQKYLHIAL